MKQIATVISTDASDSPRGLADETCTGRAKIMVRRDSACEHCASKRDCGGAHCVALSDNSKAVSEAANPVGAMAGDTVYVESRGGDILLAAVVVFLLPLIFAALGYVGAAMLAEMLMDNPNSAYVTAIGAGAAALVMLAAFEVTRVIFDRRVKRHPIVVITEIIERGERGE